MPGVLVKGTFVMDRTRHGPFLSVEDLVGANWEAQQKRTAENPAQTQLCHRA